MIDIIILSYYSYKRLLIFNMIIFKGVDDLGNLDDMLDDDGGQENYRKNNRALFWRS